MLVIQQTEQIAYELQKYMDKLCFRWKDSDNTTQYKEVKPTVYPFVFDDVTDDLPINTPSILVQLTGLNDDGTASYLVYVCVCNSAIQDKEITKPVEGKENVYKYDNGNSINSACVRYELYKSCLLLGEQVFLSLKKMNNCNYHIVNVELSPPSPFLEKFPYCECSISFDTEIPNVKTFSINNTDIHKYL